MTASRFAAGAAPDHKAVARMVAYSLHLGRGADLEPYLGLATVLRARLTPGERQGLAWAAMLACDEAEAEGIAEAVLPPVGGAGSPLPPFIDLMDDAAWWADLASPEELRTYAAACALRLSRRRAA